MSKRSLTSLRKEAVTRGVTIPKPATFARYGIEEWDWLAMLDDQEWRCPIKDHEVVQYVVDHEHVRGWKTKAPEERRKFVRGLVCNGCNYFILSRHIDSAALATRIAAYLAKYEGRLT